MLDIYDLKRDDIIKTDIDTFIGYGDMMDEPDFAGATPQDMGFRNF
jgi:hypothetical protein